MAHASIPGEIKKGVKAEDTAKKTMEKLDLLPEILNGIFSEEPRAKYNSAKILRIIGEKDPSELYTKIDFFIGLLDSEDNIIKGKLSRFAGTKETSI